MASPEENGTIETTQTHKEDLSMLLDSSYPLLKAFKDKCPGTYKHCQSLASMVETISEALGLDVVQMKVAATYHDVGKMRNPKFFTENQLQDEDLHADLDPWLSSQLITRHVSDGVNILLNDANFPRNVITIISQHHGNTVVQYFFRKAGDADPDRFRYHNVKPTSVEAAVLMIADHIEATARSKAQNQKDEFDPTDVIETTINGLLDDGQLDEVVMRLGDLKKIKIALGKELQGMYQKRVSYDLEEATERDEDVADA
jgi:hypothetical protein